ncbi:MATE family efflux transporter [Butyricimonas virosa]|uniref:MATE family efflux transporter n=3 Tax=Butyricimonas virosa TaxID=544645 RepID=UPI0021767744|nr:MATE family efflux transporter [Butyricimonas virosa]
MNWLQKYREDYSATIKIGVPIVLGQLGIVVVGLVDNIMVGHFSTSDLAAASFVNSVFNIPILFGMGFSYGLTPLVGQFFGRGDKFRVGGLLRNSLLANFMIGLFLSVVMGIMYLKIVSPKVCKFQFIYFCNRTVKNNLLWNLHPSK